MKKETQRNEQVFAASGNERCVACGNGMEGKEIPGVACLLDA